MPRISEKIYLEVTSFPELNPADHQEWYGKWRNLRSNAKLRGAVCRLTFKEYLQLAVDAGLTSPDQIGKTLGKYQMGRYTDSGDYTIESCRFITFEHNQAEKAINGGLESQANALRGRTSATDPSVKRSADARRGRTKETHEYLRISGEKRKGRTAQTHESVARMARKKTGRTAATDSGIQSMVEKRTGRTKQSHEYLQSISVKKSRSFVAFSPYGVRHEGSNAKEFALTHGLNQSELSKVFRGEVRQHKGWTGHYTD